MNTVPCYSFGHSMLKPNLYVPICNVEGQVINNDITMGFCTVIIFPLECEGLNEGFDFECFSVFEKPCLHFMV